MAVPKEWFTLDEAAEYLGVSKRTVYKWTKEGRLRTYRLGKERTRRFRKGDLDRVPQLLESGGEAGQMEALTALTGSADPVLAELWDNEKDQAYDAL